MRSINSLKDLRKARKDLAIQKKATKKAFASHLGDFRDDASKYALKKFLLPLGAGVVGAIALKFFLDNKGKDSEKHEIDPYRASRQSQQEQASEQTADSSTNWLGYVRVLLSLVKIYQKITAGRNNQAEETSETGPGNTESAVPSPRSFVQQYRAKK